MTDTQLRNEIDNFLSVADSRILAAAHAMLKSYVESEPPKYGFPNDLSPFTAAELFNLLEKPRKGRSKSAKDDMADIPF